MYKYEKNGYESLNEFIEKYAPSKILVIDDENTHHYCYPQFKKNIAFDHEVISIPPGEKNKNIETVQQLWQKMLELNLDKQSLVINLGGGIVTDLGGFVASTFKRGIPFIHVPTSLLAMVDAAIGGKNGINFGGAKNQVGVISPPEMILIDYDFLSTLPQEEIQSGYAEMLKHGLIADQNYWENLINDFDKRENIKENIKKSIQIKDNVIKQDPHEKGLRKILNFGHTLGHAIESYSHELNSPLTHGHSIALGMILSIYLSYMKTGLEFTFVNKVKKALITQYPHPEWTDQDIKNIRKYLKFDKKNISGKVLFVLLNEPGMPKYNVEIAPSLIEEAFKYLMK